MKTRYQAAMLVLLLAAPALANPSEDSGCLIGRLSTQDVSAIGAGVQAGRSDSIIQRLRPAMESCSTEQGWAPDRSRAATGYAMGVLIRNTFREQLVAQGIDTAALDGWFTRQSSQFRTTAFATMPQAEAQATMETLVGNELSADQAQRNGVAIGGYLSALMIIERIERGMPLD